MFGWQVFPLQGGNKEGLYYSTSHFNHHFLDRLRNHSGKLVRFALLWTRPKLLHETVLYFFFHRLVGTQKVLNIRSNKKHLPVMHCRITLLHSHMWIQNEVVPTPIRKWLRRKGFEVERSTFSLRDKHDMLHGCWISYSMHRSHFLQSRRRTTF